MQYTSTDNKTYEKSTLDLSDYSDMLSSVQTTDMYSDLKIVKNSVTVNGKSTVQIQAQLKGEDIAGLLAQLGLNGDNTQEHLLITVLFLRLPSLSGLIRRPIIR